MSLPDDCDGNECRLCAGSIPCRDLATVATSVAIIGPHGAGAIMNYSPVGPVPLNCQLWLGAYPPPHTLTPWPPPPRCIPDGGR